MDVGETPEKERKKEMGQRKDEGVRERRTIRD